MFLRHVTTQFSRIFTLSQVDTKYESHIFVNIVATTITNLITNAIDLIIILINHTAIFNGINTILTTGANADAKEKLPPPIPNN